MHTDLLGNGIVRNLLFNPFCNRILGVENKTRAYIWVIDSGQTQSLPICKLEVILQTYLKSKLTLV